MTAQYPQPREGIAGIARTKDDLLSLDDAAVARRLLMVNVAHALYSATLVGDPAPKVAEIYARMRSPRPGDLVMETTSFYRLRDVDTKVKGFGILLAVREEWMTSDEEWTTLLSEDSELTGDDDRGHSDAWYVQYGPAVEDVCRWTNCEFIAIPTGGPRDGWERP